ncbi:hypothetical protein [Deinococcus radiophilus]|uniref:Uncharacterized protein n=1 Tax=Deinococcus radiophilus TaxID=32062 RepID=A0A431W1H7_9DEIO|nr:hypothetical protein [Deinococcus radiophilus]RTR29367.1 hypothetical protein EJ104_02970 [Deinococcus radiophilus]UFA50806.1 hypothetical protein LMT64_02540 [Deinococcus radiophilus]
MSVPKCHVHAPKLCLHRGPCSQLVLHSEKAWFRGEDSESDLEILTLKLSERPSYQAEAAAKRAAVGWLALGTVEALASQTAEPDYRRAFTAWLNLEGMDTGGTLYLNAGDEQLERVLAHFGLRLDQGR